MTRYFSESNLEAFVPSPPRWYARLSLDTGFREDQRGAIASDWVAVTAGILLLGILVVYSVFNNGLSPLVSKINIALVEAPFEKEGNADEYEERTGNASDQACATTGKWVVCMGPK